MALAAESLRIDFIDVGQADSILIQLPNKEKMLIDGGNNEDGDLIVEYLTVLKIDKIDYLVATHPHEDHIGGLDNIINNFKVAKVYMPKVSHTSKTFRDLLIATKRKGLKISIAKAGVSLIDKGDLQVRIIGPVKEDYKELNNYSAIIKINFRNTSFLFTGDAEAEVEEELVASKIDLAADLLKIGHHGSSSSTTLSFLEKVNPQYGVISVGKNNKYDHPTKFTLEKLNRAGVEVYRTDQLGTIIAISDGEKITFNHKVPSISTTKIPNNKVPITISNVNLKDEIVLITNNSSKDINISKWKLFSLRGKQEFIFPQGTIIKAGESLKVVSGRNASKDKGQIIWTKSYIWNNNGDAAQLYDLKGNLIAEYY
jgi:beta-lactamase superfamily II metal-dependent hydrolase